MTRPLLQSRTKRRGHPHERQARVHLARDQASTNPSQPGGRFSPNSNSNDPFPISTKKKNNWKTKFFFRLFSLIRQKRTQRLLCGEFSPRSSWRKSQKHTHPSWHLSGNGQTREKLGVTQTQHKVRSSGRSLVVTIFFVWCRWPGL